MRSYDLVWESQSKSSAESMPLGGHSVGCNVWVEDDTLMLYFQRADGFDENGSLLKQGRIAVRFTENPFAADFQQRLVLKDGYVAIQGSFLSIRVWAQTDAPTVHIEIDSEKEVGVTAEYHNWRHEDRVFTDTLDFELTQCKEVMGYTGGPVVFHHDTIEPDSDTVSFWHQNDNSDLSLEKEAMGQGFSEIAAGMYNPFHDRITGGRLSLPGMKFAGTEMGRYQTTPYKAWRYETTAPVRHQHIFFVLHTGVESLEEWQEEVGRLSIAAEGRVDAARQEAVCWWNRYFEDSYILIDSADPSDQMWEIGRNYQLFRYMEGCNYYGVWPAKFNGGMFTYDPCLVLPDAASCTPDFRLWGGATYTLQNQRLLFWPMLKSGNTEMMPQAFELFHRSLGNAKKRTKFFWGLEDAAFFPEQMGSYGICNTRDHYWGNHSGFPGAPPIVNHYSSQIEISVMILEYYHYTGADISGYFDLFESVLNFFDKMFPENDENGKMILYPGSALETYVEVKNPVDCVAGLHRMLDDLLALPAELADHTKKARWQRLKDRIPPIPMRTEQGRTVISYADSDQEIGGPEFPELYPLFPYGQYGIARDGLQIARDTAVYAVRDPKEQLCHWSWHQVGIQYARLGMLPECVDYLKKKLGNADTRCPVFWGPGRDWTPDNNWGGSGEIQLQEMVMQTDGDRIFITPCWPESADLRFKLHAPKNTTITCQVEKGCVTVLEVQPEIRRGDISVIDPQPLNAKYTF